MEDNSTFKVKSLKLKVATQNLELEKLLNKIIKKVGEDIEQMKFNTAISSLMILLNEMEKQEEISQDVFANFLLILAPFAPHIAEELWKEINKEESIFLQEWPKYDQNLLKDEKVNIVIQVNGKTRGVMEVEAEASQEQVIEIAKQDGKISQWINDKEIKKVVFVKDKLINFVT